MSANDEFPRGLSLTAAQNAVNPSVTVTFPAAASIAWVLKAIKIAATNLDSPNTGNAGAAIYNGAALATVGFANGTAFGETTTDSWSGKILGALGSALVVTFSINGNTSISLTVEAYPI